jgi:dUTPase
VIDTDYLGELHLNLVNVSKNEQTIKYGQKITQFILIPISCSMPEEIGIDEYEKRETSRGSGGFGSTGV